MWLLHNSFFLALLVVGVLPLLAVWMVDEAAVAFGRYQRGRVAERLCGAGYAE